MGTMMLTECLHAELGETRSETTYPVGEALPSLGIRQL